MVSPNIFGVEPGLLQIGLRPGSPAPAAAARSKAGVRCSRRLAPRSASCTSRRYLLQVPRTNPCSSMVNPGLVVVTSHHGVPVRPP